MTNKTVSKTEYLEFEGYVNWAKVYQAETSFGKTEWVIDFFPLNDGELAKVKASGIQKTMKENTDPSKGSIGKYIKFTRPENKVIKGNLVYYTGPIILDQDGNVIVDYVSKETGRRVFSYSPENKADVLRRGSPINIGNGSKVKVTVSTYDTLKGKGHKLESLKLLELVEYAGRSTTPPPLSKMVSEMPAEPARENVKGWDTQKTLDDEIPF